MGAEDSGVYSHLAVKNLPYLNAVINEGLRLHSVAGIGFPREVPEGGMTVLGRHFSAGTVLSVPTYHAHHDPLVWGDDVDAFRPERWLEGNPKIGKAFYPFSFGPRFVSTKITPLVHR